MPHGYSQYTVTANKRASKRLLGVALGRACIARNVPVATVARELNVSRQTVYNWFVGKYDPSPEVYNDVKTMLIVLTGK